MQASSVGAYVGIKSAGEGNSRLGKTAAALIAAAVLCGYAAPCMVMLNAHLFQRCALVSEIRVCRSATAANTAAAGGLLANSIKADQCPQVRLGHQAGLLRSKTRGTCSRVLQCIGIGE